MSVLFEALSKAARDTTRTSDAVLIPMVPIQNVRGRQFSAPIVLLLVFVACALTGLSLFLFYKDDRGPVPFLTQDQRDALPDDRARPPTAFATKPTVQEGIMLPAEAISPASEQSGPLTEVEKQLVGLPMLSERNLDREASVISDEGGRVSASADSSRSSALAETLQEAAKAVQAQDWIAALTLYDEVLQISPHHNKAIDGKIFVLENGKIEGSLTEIEGMIESHPTKASLFAAQARMLSDQGRMTEALTAAKRAVSLEPGSQQLSLAILYDRLGQEAEALQAYRKVRHKDLTLEAKHRMDYLAARLRGKNVIQSITSKTSTPDQEEE